MALPSYTLTIDGREVSFDIEAEAFAMAASEFDARGDKLEISIAMGDCVYIGPLQMRHWWKMKREGVYYRDIPY
ncbi:MULTISPECIES: hypothetical protein [unclassified Hyphomicrobium]|uniref:hypothetical protein n=1 Tax=unclassified Hyphomicrobium TaxID=2619925 RepID=UPI000213E8A8|nr:MULTISPECIES: hypothetical protein [unclassified Hyphomicrobium]CCB64718.1 protein of unknown function [Hyphomicrobium sp. MC1]